MKTITSLLVFSTFLISVFLIKAPVKLKSDIEVRDNVIFDGKEGNHYFFTDSNYESITIDDDEEKLIKVFKTDPNSYIGDSFRLTVKANTSDNYLYKADSVLEIKLIEQAITKDKRMRN